MKVKNKIKQILSIIVTAMMMMSLFTVNAFAAPEGFQKGTTSGSITIEKTNTDAGNYTYSFYKILSATPQNGIYSYEATSEFSGLFGTGSDDYKIENGKITKGGSEVGDNDSAFAEAAAAIAKTKTATRTIDGSGASNVTASGLELGYYIVLQTVSDTSEAYVQKTPILIDLPAIDDGENGKTFDYAPSIKITDKSSHATVTKKIKEGSSLVDANDAGLNDTVSYSIVSDVTHYASDATNITYELEDTLSNGLTYTTGTLKVYNSENGTDTLTEGSDYTVVVNGQKITITFVYANIKDLTKVRVEYDATVNENAVIAPSENPNTVKLTYTNNTITNSTYETSDTVKTYSYKVSVNKKGSDNTEKLGGAIFDLYKKNSDGTTYALIKQDLTTVKDNLLVIDKLDAGDYKLVEKTAPEGYVLPASEESRTTEFTITATTGTNNEPNGGWTVSNSEDKVISIINSKGFNLPTTGGAGTWMFTIGGLVLMAGAVVVFMATRKKKAN